MAATDTATADATATRGTTTTERTSDRDVVVTRIIDGPPRLVFEAWTKAELLQRWWVPKSMPMRLLACETDPRTGGRYRLAFDYEGSTYEFFGRYLEVVPPSRIVWTNEEGGEGEATITTVTLEEVDGRTLVVVHDRYPSKEALDQAIASGATAGLPEQLDQLEELLATLA